MADRKRTNAEIDAINASLTLAEGDTPLPYEIDENNIPELTDEEKLAAEQKVKADADAAQKLIDDAAEAEKNKTNPANNPPAPIEAELDDEKVLAYLKNKKGKEATSLDELLNPKKELTDEEKKVAAEQRDANKIAYGLSKGLFTEKELKSFIIDTQDPKGLVYASYVADQKSKDEALTDDEIKEEFDEKFGLNQKEESRQYKAGQTLINNIANNLIRQKHSKILNLDSDFTSYETSQSKQKEAEQKILSQAPVYKKDVERVKNEMKKVSFQISKDEVFETELDDDVVNEVISGMLDNKYSQTQIESGWTKDGLMQIGQTSAIIKQLPNILKKYGDAQILKHQAGVRGIPPTGKQGSREIDKTELSERQKVAASYYGLNETIAN